MKIKTLTFTFLPILLALVLAMPAAAASTSNAFDSILIPYEQIRVSLTHDSIENVARNGRLIAQILEDLEADFTASRAGVEAGELEQARALLPEIKNAVDALSSAQSLDAARDAFYTLSKPLVRWRKAATGERPIVAYCSMSKRSWLQPEGEIGNPYYGQSMLHCGEPVDG